MDRGEERSRGVTATSMETLTAITASLLSSKIASPSDAPPPPSPLLLLLPGGRFLHLLRRFLLLSFHALLSLLLPLYPVRPNLHSSPTLANLDSSSPAADGTSAPAPARALTRVLSLVARIPVASRKYELVRSVTKRFLDDNSASALPPASTSLTATPSPPPSAAPSAYSRPPPPPLSPQPPQRTDRWT